MKKAEQEANLAPLDYDSAPVDEKNAVNPGSSKAPIVIKRSRKLTSEDELLLDFGKDLVKNSISQSLDFHKTMLGLTATFATLMASAFGILVVGTSEKQLDNLQRFFLSVPVFIMLMSSVAFVLGYYPRYTSVQLRHLDRIRHTRNKLVRIRARAALSGVALFVLSIVSLLVGILFVGI
jgi:hypothetical protein